MDWKNFMEKELKEVRQLADYNSEDAEATKRLTAIRKKVESALDAIKQVEEIQ